jgi:hypothetical protein
MVSITFIPSWRVRKSSLAILFLSFFTVLVACEDPQEIGSEVFAQDIGVLFTDTLTVDASTILLDSISTSNTDNLLVGRYTDPLLGVVEASSYFHVANADTLRSAVDTAGRKAVKWLRYPSKVDSIRFVLPYSLYQGDTLQTQTFTLSQLSDDALLDATKTYYSNSDAPALKSTILGQVKNVKIRPIKNKNIISGAARFDSLRIPITDPTFVNFVVSQRDVTIKDNVLIGTGFRSKIRGMALSSTSNKNAALVGFSVADNSYSTIKIYYNYSYTYTLLNKAGTADSITVKVDTVKANNLYVGLYSTTAQGGKGAPVNARFNKITTSRTGSFSKLVKVTDGLKSALSNNLVGVQSSSGMAMKVNFTTLAKLKERQDIAINKAEIVLEPQNSSSITLPQSLVLMESTKDNRLLRSTSAGDGSIVYVSSLGDTYYAVYNSKSNNYSFNITSSLQNILSGRIKTNGWVISANNIVSTANGVSPISGRNIVSSDVNRAIFDAKNIKLKVYYTYVGK